jgi:hypothetical protein
MITLIIDSNWEKDFLFKYILGEVRNDNYFFVKSYQLSEQFVNDLLKQSKDFILIFSSNQLSYSQTALIVEKLKPKIIIHNSDEHGTRPEFMNISKHTKLLLLQYGFYHKPLPSNTLHLPLPFLPGIHLNGIPSWDTLKPIELRKYDWSFVGGMKSDRKLAINTFEKGWYDCTSVHTGNLSRIGLSKLYKDSKFVISPRGNISMMCCRTFEAITCGAIPVLAGCTRSEMEDTYNFNVGMSVPFIHANTWYEAVEICKNLKNIEEVQHNCMEWYKQIIDNIKNRIHNVLEL